MIFMQDWREEIHHARLCKPEWRFYIRILDALKALATLALASMYAYGLWYILYGVPSHDKKADAPVVQVVSSPSESDSLAEAKIGIRTVSTQQPVVQPAADSISSVAPSPGTNSRSNDEPESIAVAKSISRSKEVMRARKTPQLEASHLEVDSLQSF